MIGAVRWGRVLLVVVLAVALFLAERAVAHADRPPLGPPDDTAVVVLAPHWGEPIGLTRLPADATATADRLGVTP